MDISEIKKNEVNFIGTIISSDAYVLPAGLELLSTFEVKLILEAKEFVIQIDEKGKPINSDEFTIFVGKTLATDAPLPETVEEMLSSIAIMDWITRSLVIFKAMEAIHKGELGK